MVRDDGNSILHKLRYKIFYSFAYFIYLFIYLFTYLVFAFTVGATSQRFYRPNDIRCSNMIQLEHAVSLEPRSSVCILPLVYFLAPVNSL